MACVEYFQGADGQWYARLVGGNGQIWMVSEGYTRRSSAKRSAEKVAKAVGVEARQA